MNQIAPTPEMSPSPDLNPEQFASADGQRVNLIGIPRAQLNDMLVERGHKPFRTKQLWQWLYWHGVTDFDAMTNLSKADRARLGERASLDTLAVDTIQRARDGTRKLRLRTADGEAIESVRMDYDPDGPDSSEPREAGPSAARTTVCVSTQAGCAMGCVFCATGQMGFARHLSASEIFEQAMIFSAELEARGERLSNVVLMGMGEPFHNYDATLAAIRRLNGELGIGARHITVSTVGLVPQIRRFAEEGIQVTLAISLHAATDAEREALLPINKRWPLAELMDAEPAMRLIDVRTPGERAVVMIEPSELM